MNDFRQEISQVSDLLGTPLPENWSESLLPFAAAAQTYLEYQIALATGELALITLGRDKAYLDTIATTLESMGVSQEGLGIFQSMRRYVGEATWGLKLTLGASPEVQVYVKRPLPVPEVLLWLQQRTALTPSAAETIQTVAQILDKPYTHFVGADFTPGQPVPFQIYFTQYTNAETPVAQRLEQVMAQIGLPTSAQEEFHRYYPVLSQPNQTIWASLGLVNGAIAPSLKLDYSSVRFGVVGLLLEGLHAPASQLTLLDELATLLHTDTASYMGYRLKANQPTAVSLYLTRISRG